jgi:hypothetical protein
MWWSKGFSNGCMDQRGMPKYGHQQWKAYSYHGERNKFILESQPLTNKKDRSYYTRYQNHNLSLWGSSELRSEHDGGTRGENAQPVERVEDLELGVSDLRQLASTDLAWWHGGSYNLAVDLEGCGGSQALVEVPKASTKMTTIVWSGNESKRKWCNNAKVRELWITSKKTNMCGPILLLS